MENSLQTYCYIDIKLVPSFYEGVLNRLNWSKYLTLDNINGKNCLCFIMDNHLKKDEGLDFEFENQVFPFIFINDKASKMFVDVITNKSYPYGSVNKGIGDFIEEVHPVNIELSKEDVLRYINTIPFARYKEILEEFEKVVKDAYKITDEINRAIR